MHLVSFIIFGFALSGVYCSPCAERFYGEEKLVCVCNSTYCDELVVISDIPPKTAVLYESSAAGSRFVSSFLPFIPSADSGKAIVGINSSQTFQFILGFGGAFTDAAGINILSLPSSVQKQLLKSYFSESGLQYNMGRIPIASCDFSTSAYSYDDVEGDFELKNFQLAKEDLLYKIPLIQSAQSILGDKQELLLFGSPWSAPGWMKTNGKMNGQGQLKGDPGNNYHATWADYLVRFLKAYSSKNITMWGLTLQNEPSDGCIPEFRFQSMCFTPERQRDFIKMNLGPALKNAGFSPDKLRLMVVDDIRLFLPISADVILNDPEAAQYVSGIAFHWYQEFISPFKLLDVTHAAHPEYFLLSTEACTGYQPWDFPKVSLGNWNRAEQYAHDIAQDLTYWSIGWVDWNLALNLQGGPNWVKNFVDSPIIIDASRSEFLKQPMYYAISHFSKFITRGSIHIGLNASSEAKELLNKIDLVAFETPENQIVVVIVNKNDNTETLFLHDPTKGYLNATVPPHSIQTYVW